MSTHKGGLGDGLFGKESSNVIDVYLNLTPLMDVMSNILFFLLSAFGASAVAVYSITVPIDASGEASESDAPPEDKVTVTLRAEKLSLTVGCTNPAKTADQLKVCSAKLPGQGNDFDIAGMSQVMLKIKETFPAATTVIVVPDDDLPYETLVKILDGTRDIVDKAGKPTSLFPDVVLSSLVK